MRKGYFNGELTEREKEIEKEIRRENIKEAIALIIAVPLFLLLMWLFLVGTPDQRSAEADMAAGDWRRAIYWFAAAVLTATVTY